MKDIVKHTHQNYFGDNVSSLYYSPATMILLGEGFDNLKGPILSIAIDKGLTAGVSARDDLMMQIHLSFHGEWFDIQLDLSNIEKQQPTIYGRLLVSMIKKLQYEGYKVSKGLNVSVVLDQTLPENLGMHPSFLMLFMKIFITQNLFTLNQKKMVRYAFYAEKTNQELNSSIAHHFTCLHGKKNHLIKLDIMTLEHSYIPFDDKQYQLISVFVARPKFIVNADITERIKAVDKATNDIRETRAITYLSELSLKDFHGLKKYITNSKIVPYIEHVVFEIDRVIQAVDHLENKDYVMFGDVLEQSQNSIKHLYDISNQYYNDLIKIMMDNYTLGARLSLIGYDQIIIALFEHEDVPKDFKAYQDSFYKQYKKSIKIDSIKISQGLNIIK